MKKISSFSFIILMITLFSSCSGSQPEKLPVNSDSTGFSKGEYGYDQSFLKRYTSHVVELRDSTGNSKVLLSADYQGRVMTSTASGDSGSSFGWINFGLIASGQKKQHFNPYGGEERFWIGPEGGQYSLYFAKGDSFNVQHWQVPGVIDTIAYDIVQSDATHAVFSKKAELVNYSGKVFDIEITRSVRLLDKQAVENKLQTAVPDGVQFVGFESTNEIRNAGQDNWKKENGLLSIWLLGMMTPTDETKVMIPFHGIQNARSLITDNYFGAIPPDRLRVEDSVLYFRCDGKMRGKIGISPKIAKPVAGSFDFKKNVLTLLFPEIHADGLYVNSKWEIQKDPYSGDVVNSYNDGALPDGSQMGPFYEVESSSPAEELKSGESEKYTQTTCHFQGDYKSLREMTLQVLKVDLDNLKKW